MTLFVESQVKGKRDEDSVVDLYMSSSGRLTVNIINPPKHTRSVRAMMMEEVMDEEVITEVCGTCIEVCRTALCSSKREDYARSWMTRQLRTIFRGYMMTRLRYI